MWEAPFQTDAGIYGGPVVSDGTVYVSDYDGYVYAVDAGTGRPQWETPVKIGENINHGIAVSDGVLFCGDPEGILYAIDVDAGAIGWRYELGRGVESTPVVAGESLYIGCVDAVIAIS